MNFSKQEDRDLVFGQVFAYLAIIQSGRLQRVSKLLSFFVSPELSSVRDYVITHSVHKHLKKSNAACFYTPVVLKLLIIVQMWKQHEEGN